jgi:hypothetical protein
MTYPVQALKEDLDNSYPSQSTFGYAALLNDTTVSNLNYTVNFTTNQLTTAIAHGLVTGTRVRSTASVAQPGVAPSGTLNGSTDYFVRVVSATVLQLHLTLAEAQSSTNPIDFTDAGSGTLQLNEQVINAEDAMNVLVNHEVTTHPDYSRFELIPANDAVNVNGEAQKQTGAWSLVVNSSSPALTFGSVLIIKDGSSTAGNSSSGTVNNLTPLSSPITISPGSSKTYIIEFARLN